MVPRQNGALSMTILNPVQRIWNSGNLERHATPTEAREEGIAVGSVIVGPVVHVIVVCESGLPRKIACPIARHGARSSKVRIGIDVLWMFCETLLSLAVGMILPGKTCPVVGSVSCLTPPALKLPDFQAGSGTFSVSVVLADSRDPS